MIQNDKHALVCDLAETYHILNYRELPVLLVASLCYGLKPNSRSKMMINNMKYELNTVLLAGVVDRLSILVWSKTKDAQKGKNKPKSIVSELVNEKVKDKYRCFKSGKDFEEERRKILKNKEETCRLN